MPPIKRHQTLIVFSRNHHKDLMVVWKIRRGIAKKVAAERIATYLFYAWQNEVALHIIQEEQNLYALCRHSGELILQAFKEHIELTNAVGNIEKHPSYPVLEEFATSLEKHTRFEERVLFNDIQEKHTAEQLALIARNNENLAECAAVNWEDQFWLNDSNKKSS